MSNRVARLAEARTAGLEAELRMARKEARTLQNDLARALQIGEEVQEATIALAPLRPWKPVRVVGKRTPVWMLALFSDLQAGETVRSVEVHQWNRYNRAIMLARVRYYAERVLQWARGMRHLYDIRGLVVLVLGDLISGDIHEELMRTNEVDPPVQAVEAGRVLGNFVRSVSSAFPKVRVEMIGGSNHSRLTRRYQFKRGAMNSFDYVAHEIAAGVLADHKKARLVHHPGREALVTIEGWKFLCGHGDDVMSWMGIPWYGIQRAIRRKGYQHMKQILEEIREGRPVRSGFDVAVGAHWHTPFWLDGEFMVNGSFTGTTELDVAAGRGSAPKQMTAFLSKNHGLFGSVAWRLDRPKVEQPLERLDWAEAVAVEGART